MSNLLRDRARNPFSAQQPIGDEFAYGGGEEGENNRPNAAVLPRRLALSVEASGALDLGNFRLTRTGLEIEGVVTEEQWRNLGSLIGRIDTSVQWLLGDWMAYGERTWGKTYEQVAELTGYEIQTLRDYAWVARRVDLSSRKDKLSFKHHKLVAHLDDPGLQRQWLDYALDNYLSVSQMQAAIEGNPPALSTGNAPLDRFQRAFTPFQQRVQRIAHKAGQGDRQQIASWLRNMADEIEQGDLG